jgi:hypothetical protein
MPRPAALALWTLNLAAVGVLLATCAAPGGDTPAAGAVPVSGAGADATELLPGTWLREYAVQGLQVRRTLVLGAGGAFREAVRMTDAAGEVKEYAHEGTWLYDGRNLKRKYSSVNGEPPSRRNLPFATFEITFASRNEFTGVDHIHHNRVVYRRVAPDASP